jgi:hypothetical protein
VEERRMEELFRKFEVAKEELGLVFYGVRATGMD